LFIAEGKHPPTQLRWEAWDGGRKTAPRVGWTRGGQPVRVSQAGRWVGGRGKGREGTDPYENEGSKIAPGVGGLVYWGGHYSAGRC